VLLVGLAFVDVMNRLVERQFTDAMRQDATLSFVQPRSGRVLHDVTHLPGVLDVEPMRVVPVRLRAGTRSRTISLMGLPETPRLNLVLDRTRGPLSLSADGLTLSRALAALLDVRVGDLLRVEVLEGRRSLHTLPVAGLVDDALGLQVYMRLDDVRRLLREGPTVSAVAATVDEGQRERFYAEVKASPGIAGVAMLGVVRQNFRDTLAEHMYIQIAINVAFAAIIAFGVVYNSARVSLSERSRELASLRVLGFTRGEISRILLGELAVLTVLALPLGALIGYGLGRLILETLSNEVYRLTFIMRPATLGRAWLAVAAAAAVSGFVVRRRLDRLDLVGVLKTPE
jgi:putative ABC transport system permease protein